MWSGFKSFSEEAQQLKNFIALMPFSEKTQCDKYIARKKYNKVSGTILEVGERSFD